MPTKSKKKGRDLTWVKTEILKNLRNRRGLLRIRSSMPPSMVDPLLEWVASNRTVQESFGLQYFPKTFVEMEPRLVGIHDDVAQELRWLSGFILSQSQAISDFISLAKAFETHLLRSSIDECFEILATVEKTYGPSLWLISNKLALLQLTQGLEYQKSYSAEVIAQCSPNGGIAFIVYYLSIRNEASVSPNRFAHLLNNNLSIVDMPNSWQTYTRTYLLPESELSESEIIGALGLSSGTSVIDTYETLLQIGITMVGSPLEKIFVEVFRKLRLKIEDDRLEAVLFRLRPQELTHPATENHILSAANAFVTRNLKSLVTSATRGLDENPNNFALWELLAIGWATLGSDDIRHGVDEPNLQRIDQNNGFYRHILTQMSRWIRTGRLASDEIKGDLFKITLNFLTHRWARNLNGFLWSVLTSQPLMMMDNRIQTALASHIFLNPLDTPIFPSYAYQRAVADLLEVEYGDTPAVRFALGHAYGESTSFPPIDFLSGEEESLLRAEICFRDQDFAQCISLAGLLCDSNLSYYRAKGVRIKGNALIQDDLLVEAIRFIATELVKDSELNPIVPIELLIEKLGDPPSERFQSEICLPIIYDFYSNYFSEEFDHLRNYAYQDFLASQGVTRPSELLNLAEGMDVAALVYFLRNIAVESVMDISRAFETSREVANERLAVCRRLVELDPDNLEAYQAEIKDINRRLMLRERLREIERSKIYVDTESVKRKIASKTIDNFNRYLAFIDFSTLTGTIQALTEKYRRLFDQENEGPIVIFHIPDDEQYQLFRNMFVEIRDEFVSSNEHGLDAYLSVRIRHGTLRGQLRSPVEACHLITQKDSKTGRYKNNQYWESWYRSAEGLHAASGNSADFSGYVAGINTELARFSEAFDSLVSEIISDWIQIRKEADDPGMFDFVFSTHDISNLSRTVTTATSFDEFIDSVLNLLESRLRASLERIRNRFAIECKARVNGLLTNLQSSVENLGSRYGIPPNDLIFQITNARTELTTVINRIMEWFTLAATTAKQPFRIEDAIGIGQASVNTFVPSFTTSVTAQPGLKQLHGSMLTGLVDVLFILFDNIVKHSGMHEASNADISVNYETGTFVIRIVNPVSPEIRVSEIQQKLQDIRDGIEQGKYMKAISSEGGTGFYKIMKILKHDVGIEPMMHFGFEDEDKFFVEIHLPMNLQGGAR